MKSKRLLISFLALLLLPPAAAVGQFTQVQGTVVDPHGVPYSNGTIFPTLVISGSPRFTSSGFPYVPPSQATALDARGAFVMSIADVTQLTPSGGLWTFTVNCAAGCIPPAAGIGPVTFTTVGLIISGTVQDISTVLQAAAPPLSGGGGGGGGVTSINGSSGALTVPSLNCTGATCTQSNPTTIGPPVVLAAGSLAGQGVGAIGISTQTTSTISPPSGTAWFWALNAGGPAYGWQPIPYIMINGSNPSGQVSAQQWTDTTPAAPANGINVRWQRALAANTFSQQISAAIVGSGNATDCLIGTGTFSPCPSGAGGVTSINGTGGAFTFTGAGVSCATTTCTFTGVGSGISGSGTVPFVPVFTGATAIGNSNISSTANQLIFGNPAVIGNPGIQKNVTGTATTNCVGVNTTPLGINVANIGCIGERLTYQNQASTNAGVSVGMMVNSNGGTTAGGQLGIGLFSEESGGAGTAETRAGYFEAFESLASTITTRRGLMGFAGNGTGNTTAVNEGIVAQSGGTTGTNTLDYGLHCLAPVSGTTLTTHACVKIDAQGTGVEFQTAAHAFVNLPACSTAYEGSIAAINDSTVTSGTITGGGTNHVLAFCNGSVWAVAGGGGGGGGSVGAGTAGQFAVYNSSTSVVGSSTLSDTGTAINFTEPLRFPSSASCAAGASGITQLCQVGSGLAIQNGTGGLANVIKYPQVNGTSFGANVGNFNFNSSTPVAPTNGINVQWQFTAGTGAISAAVVGNGVATNCLSGIGTYVPCSGGSGTAPPIKVGTCDATTGASGVCNVVFPVAFTSTPICTVSAVQSTLTVTNFMIGNAINQAAFSIVYAPTTASVLFDWICVGNPN